MSFNVNSGIVSGTVNAVVTGNITTTLAPVTQLRWYNTATTTTAACPTGKRWRIISAGSSASAGTASFLAIMDNAGTTVRCYIVRKQTIATYGDGSDTNTVAGDCVAIVDAGDKIQYSGNATTCSGFVCYIEESV